MRKVRSEDEEGGFICLQRLLASSVVAGKRGTRMPMHTDDKDEGEIPEGERRLLGP